MGRVGMTGRERRLRPLGTRSGLATADRALLRPASAWYPARTGPSRCATVVTQVRARTRTLPHFLKPFTVDDHYARGPMPLPVVTGVVSATAGDLQSRLRRGGDNRAELRKPRGLDLHDVR